MVDLPCFKENPLSAGSVKQEEVDEEALLQEQLATIQNSVKQVEVTEKSSTVSNRKREVDEVNELLDGLDDDDDEEEDVQTMTLGGNEAVDEPMEAVEEQTVVADLLAAKKKKKKL
uniref:Uncharacterized protein n=1 Tax=Caenorhabditis japonica TaxID=281687 RepID=A0A8R1ERK5_CAEJA